MPQLVKCAFCREEIQGEPVKVGGKSYCCEACAFEGSQAKGSICGGRNTVASSLAYKPPKKPCC